MSFVIKDVNCNFLLQGGLGAVGGIVGSPRTYDSTTGVTLLTRGIPYFRKAAIRGAPIPGIVVGYYSTAVPRMTNPADYARYESAERGSFEAFNYIYKVWMPCIKAELSVEDFEDKNKKQFLKKVASMADVTVSLGANEVQGAIPPGTLVDVKFDRKYALKNPQIVNIKEKIFDISTAFPDPPGRPFVLGSSFGAAGTLNNPPGAGWGGPTSGHPPSPVSGINRQKHHLYTALLPGLQGAASGQVVIGDGLVGLSSIVLSELAFWQGKKETTSNAYPRLKAYWENLGWTEDRWTPSSVPWSAAYISYVVRKVDPQFPQSAAHFKYSKKAKEKKGNWSAFKTNSAGDVRAQLGDILVMARTGGNRNTHGDVVYKIEGGNAWLSGGNLGNTAKGNVTLALDASQNYSNYGSYEVVLKKNGRIETV